MVRYVAFLRGVSPMNLKMPELKACLEEAGFANVKTLLSSGNAVFDSAAKSAAQIERKVEKAMQARIGRSFYTIVRSVDELKQMLADEPFAAFDLAADAKRVVTFLREPAAAEVELPIEKHDAWMLAMTEREVFSAYVPGPKGPVFMTLIEKTFGTEVTTRTLDTVKKCVKA